VTPETLDACARGTSMMVHWLKGRGEIFTAATCEWVMGRSRGDAQVIAVTRNVMDHFGVMPTT
jgi:hypothetical protein